MASPTLSPDQAWRDLIHDAETLLAYYPGCMFMMPDDDARLGRVLQLADKIREAIDCDPMAS